MNRPPPAVSPDRAPDARTMRHRKRQRPHESGLRQTLYDVIFEADTPAGRGFDIALLIAIVLSVVAVSLETLPGLGWDERAVPSGWPLLLFICEWTLTLVFTIEYGLRLYCVRHPWRYALSFWGVVDLLSILPGYLTLFSRAAASLAILRSIRLLRVFRVLKLWRMMSQADELADAVWHSRDKIVVFLAVVLVAVTISGTLMYHIETTIFGDPQTSQFTSIPQSMYWAIVTMTTVGYGDVVPQTVLGKIISAVLILLGYSLIIVPTGFVSAELSGRGRSGRTCSACGQPAARAASKYCDDCGASFASLPT